MLVHVLAAQVPILREALQRIEIKDDTFVEMTETNPRCK